MEATAPEFIGATLHGELSDPVPVDDYMQFHGAQKFSNGFGVEINTPDYTIFLYEGGNFKIEDVRGREYMYRAETKLEKYADKLDTEVRKFRPHDATFTGKLHNMTSEDVDALQDHIDDLPHLKSVKKFDDPFRPDISAEIPVGQTDDGEDKTATVNFFISNREYSVTDTPVKDDEDIEDLAYTLHNKVHHGILRKIEERM